MRLCSRLGTSSLAWASALAVVAVVAVFGGDAVAAMNVAPPARHFGLLAHRLWSPSRPLASGHPLPAKRQFLPPVESEVESNLWRPIVPAKKSRTPDDILDEQIQGMAELLGSDRLVNEFQGLERGSQEFNDAILRLLLELRSKGYEIQETSAGGSGAGGIAQRSPVRFLRVY